MRYWSVAQIDLRLSVEDFWSLTPRQFGELLKRQSEQNEYQELLTGIIASTVANWSFGAPKKPLSPAIFMPSQRDRVVKESKPATRFNRKAVADQIRGFIRAQMAKQDAGVTTS